MNIFKSSWMFWFLGLPSVLILLIVFVVGSRLLINPTKVSITPCGKVLMFRDYPLVDWLGFNYPMVRYQTTVTGMTPGTNRGYPCGETNKWRYSQDLGRGFNQWTINHYAETCMQDPVGFTFESSFTAYLFDVIPLRPVVIRTAVACRDTAWDLCAFRGEP